MPKPAESTASGEDLLLVWLVGLPDHCDRRAAAAAEALRQNAAAEHCAVRALAPPARRRPLTRRFAARRPVGSSFRTYESRAPPSVRRAAFCVSGTGFRAG
jgi:hypothetical protein